MTTRKYKDKYLDIDYYDGFLTLREADLIYDYLIDFFEIKTRRNGMICGADGMIYKIRFGGYGGRKETISEKKVIDWEKLKYIKQLGERISDETGQTYNVCAIQFYSSGDIGINKHKDREMVKGTMICGISLGQRRKLVMYPPKFLGNDNIEINLKHGSLYILNPPTNDWWMHSIPKDDSKHARISLTFRNYK